jgi:hypothetical protein
MIPADQGDPTLADGILDRLVHNANRIEIVAIRWAKIAESRADNSR